RAPCPDQFSRRPQNVDNTLFQSLHLPIECSGSHMALTRTEFTCEQNEQRTFYHFTSTSLLASEKEARPAEDGVQTICILFPVPSNGVNFNGRNCFTSYDCTHHLKDAFWEILHVYSCKLRWREEVSDCSVLC
ncbi:hypothetical protein BaRGS_00006898, partial [Batillaria attramentaria]